MIEHTVVWSGGPLIAPRSEYTSPLWLHKTFEDKRTLRRAKPDYLAVLRCEVCGRKFRRSFQLVKKNQLRGYRVCCSGACRSRLAGRRKEVA